jgi:hypothetical protein
MKTEPNHEKYLEAYSAKRKAFRHLLELEEEGAKQSVIDEAERKLNGLREICKGLSDERMSEAMLRMTA